MAEQQTCIAGNSRILYFFVNFVVWIFGLVLIAVGGFILQNVTEFAFVYASKESELVVGCWILIGLGCTVFLAGFNGVWACMKESVLGMKVYFVVMLLLVIAELVVGILALVGREQVEASTMTTMKEQIQNEYGNGGLVDEGYNSIQEQSKCCGVEGYVDWEGSYFLSLPENDGIAVPESCCIPKNKTGCNTGKAGKPDKLELVHGKGCGEAVVSFHRDNITLLGMICLIMVALETIALLLVCCVISTKSIPERPDKSESFVEEEDKL